MITNNIFATPLSEFEIDLALCQHCKNVLIEEADFSEHPLNYCTADDLHEREVFAGIKTVIDFHTKQYTEQVLKINHEDLTLTGLWSNIQKNHQSHPIHQHPNSFVSGVVYIDIPEDGKGGELVFVDPRQAKNMFYPNFVGDSHISDRWMTYTPVTGKMLLFPSWLEHGTQPFFAKETEYIISMSFNYQLIRSDFSYGRF